MNELDVAAANARLADFVTVDVRGTHEFAGPLGHVRGALPIPLPELEARARELPRGRNLLLVCRSGARSAKACQQLEALGYGPATNLVGGMIAWGRAGLAVEKTRYADATALVENALAWLGQVTGQPRDAVHAKLEAEAGDVASARTKAAASRALDWVEASARASGAPPDTELSLAAYRAALAEL
ncbi:MAG TPA: rhodanese-like domain-containing protein [Myxococcota bacterium]|jgi:rhodanese-related sulfurtransferase